MRVSILLLFGALLIEGAIGAESFGLAEPRVLKADWETRGLCSGDIDGDGRTDLAMINNEKARIEIFYQLAPGEKPGKTKRTVKQNRWEPQFEDAPFERDKVFTGGEAIGLALGDLNGDGRMDFVYSNDRDEIVIHFQGEDGEWSKGLIKELESLVTDESVLTVWDLHGDGRADLVVVGFEKIMIFPDCDVSSAAKEYPTAFSGLSALQMTDIDRDGRLDLGYGQMVGGERYFVVRRQDEEGAFFGERFFEVEGLSSQIEPFGIADADMPDFVTVSSENGTLQRMGFRFRSESKDVSPAVRNKREAVAYAVPEMNGGDSLFVVADFNGDGKADVATSKGESARVWVFFQGADGRFGAQESYPAYSLIKGLAAGDVDGDGLSELLILSEEEKSLGMARFEDGRLSFPARLPLEAEPRVVAVSDVDGDGRAEVCVAETGSSSRTYKISIFREGEDGEWSGVDITGEKQVRSRLEDILFADVNQDGRTDLLAVSSDQPAMIFLQDEEGKFGVNFETGEIAPKSLSVGDIDGDGKDELLLTQESFARSVRYDGENNMEVVDQINAPVSDAELLASVFLDTDGDSSDELVLVDRSNGSLYVMQRDENHVFRDEKTLEIVADDFERVEAVDLNGDGKKSLLLFGEGHFWHVPTMPSELEVLSTRLHETDILDMDYLALLTGDLNSDGRHDVVAIDHGGDGLMEVLLTEEGKDTGESTSLRSAMHFKLFEKDQHYRGRQGGSQQPHDGLLADLNHDGKLDICLLVHDRLLVYVQR